MVLLHKGQPCLDIQGSHLGHLGRLDHPDRRETHPEDQTFDLEMEDTVHTEEDTVRLARNLEVEEVVADFVVALVMVEVERPVFYTRVSYVEPEGVSINVKICPNKSEGRQRKYPHGFALSETI